MADASITRRAVLGSAAALWVLRGQEPRRLPNVVLIYADDLGYGDLGCYGSRLSTPNIDRLAAEGVRFTHCCSANPVCSPSRAALLTGRYPTRSGVPRVLFPNAKSGLPASEATLAELLKPRGYRTLCVGKWHLGDAPEYLPTRRGFDEYFGIPYSNDMHPRLLLDGERVVEETATLETLTARYTARAVQFIQSSRGRPFLLYLAQTYPHIPLAAGAKFRGKSPAGLYGDVVAELDWGVGQVLETLRQQRLERETLVIFSSDNGPWYQGSAGALRGRKGSTWEGGVRVPLIMRQPGTVSAGRISEELVSTMDLLPTVLGMAGVAKQRDLDGVDISALVSGSGGHVRRDVLLYFDDVHVQCAREGDWKLHLARYNSFVYGPAPQGGRVNLPLADPELYNLRSDPSESYDVAAEHPDVVARIRGRVEALISGFPADVQRAYQETRSRPTIHAPAGALPRPKATV